MTFLRYLALFLTPLAFSLPLSAEVVHLVAGEREPYIGKRLQNQGYVSEVVTEAFARTRIQVDITFYPWARALALVKQGKADGIVPIYQEANQDNLLFSAPFPGDALGLLKRRDNPFQYQATNALQLEQLLLPLRHSTVGIVRGGLSLPQLGHLVPTEYANSDLQNIDKLYYGRLPYILIDKYTAVDLMVGHRPHYIGELEFLQPALAEKSFHVAFFSKAPHVATLLEAFNHGLAQMRLDGTLSRLRAKNGLLLGSDPLPHKVKLTIGSVDNPDMRIMQRLGKLFEQQNPDIELNWVFLEERILRRRLLGDLAIADGQFDVMTIGNFEAPIWARRHWLVPLENLPDSYDVADIIPVVKNALSSQGLLYALPFYAESAMTFYRKDLFAKAGLNMPPKPSFTDIAALAAKLNNPEKQIYGICLRGDAGWGGNMALLTSWVHAMGGRWFDEHWQPQLQTAEWVQTLQLYQQLLQQYGQPHATRTGFTEVLQLFAKGHCAIWIDATVAAGYLYDPEVSKVASVTGFAAQPTGKLPAQWLWVWALAIPDSSKNKTIAQRFIAWATSKEYIGLVGEHESWVAAPPGTRMSTYHRPEYQQRAPFANEVFQAIAQSRRDERTLKPVPYNGTIFVGIPEYAAFGTRVGNRVAEVVDGKIKIDQALQQSQDIVLKQMQDSGYLNPNRNPAPATESQHQP
ncbi:extracellular solute-binding protein [Shewanella yunxiaonensis]|uniref:Extracellular solute-binding protein n=1 Tax=Shewanella yunxiaonensis TaxID=2829809 RepID=A0ABX7YU60_9GAMM|nr:extracellular solute-binding protein [Shewanella yunxiaonensis]QUN06318.1 extracellular solute-binding protein [Shewanella yunxiaonensis]